MNLDKEWIWAAVLLPVFIGFFKEEISNLLTAWSVYRLRAFDVDGNPATSDTCQILCSATGRWIDVEIERYLFWAGKKRRGVYLKYDDGGEEKVSFLTWASFRKRKKL